MTTAPGSVQANALLPTVRDLLEAAKKWEKAAQDFDWAPDGAELDAWVGSARLGTMQEWVDDAAATTVSNKFLFRPDSAN
jgi:hypothetical protein